MNRFIKTFLLGAVILIGAWALFNRDEIHSIGDAIELAKRQVSSGTSGFSSRFELVKASDYWAASERTDVYANDSYIQNVPVSKTTDFASDYLPGTLPTIRIASFKMDSDTAAKNIGYAADICEQYDIIAIQNNSKLRISQLNSELKNRNQVFSYVDQAQTGGKFSFLFRIDKIRLEEQHWYTVNDPEDLFLNKPLVAWFRTVNVPPEVAFTFTLANVQLNQRDPDREVAQLGQLFRAIRMDGRSEDDILIAGDFVSSDQQIRELKSKSGLVSAIEGMATNTRNDTQLDNLVFDPRATIEFTGQSGVFDFMKRFNLTLVDAMSISNRMPIWAEFSSVEGRLPGRAAEAHWGSAANR